MVFAVYGLNQGVGEGWLYVLQRYFFKDILILSPAHAQMLTAVARTPWNVKVCYAAQCAFLLTRIVANLWNYGRLFTNLWVSSNLLYCFGWNCWSD